MFCFYYFCKLWESNWNSEWGFMQWCIRFFMFIQQQQYMNFEYGIKVDPSEETVFNSWMMNAIYASMLINMLIENNWKHNITSNDNSIKKCLIILSLLWKYLNNNTIFYIFFSTHVDPFSSTVSLVVGVTARLNRFFLRNDPLLVLMAKLSIIKKI